MYVFNVFELFLLQNGLISKYMFQNELFQFRLIEVENIEGIWTVFGKNVFLIESTFDKVRGSTGN